jgi:hypothetical protein
MKSFCLHDKEGMSRIVGTYLSWGNEYGSIYTVVLMSGCGLYDKASFQERL